MMGKKRLVDWLIIFACLTLLLHSFYASADSLMSLPQMEGFAEFNSDNQTNYTGYCGETKIEVANVGKFVGNSFGFSRDVEPDKTGVTLIAVNKVLFLKYPVLSDFNGIACVKTKSEKKILVWNTCGGSACSDTFNSFYIIDPKKLEFIMPKNLKNHCNQYCATKVIGKKLIEQINH